jgi:hypothetical protein
LAVAWPSEQLEQLAAPPAEKVPSAQAEQAEDVSAALPA